VISCSICFCSQLYSPLEIIDRVFAFIQYVENAPVISVNFVSVFAHEMSSF
jgi:hypothetical protein